MEPVLAFVTHNVTALRAEPNGSSEQISQAILGDRMEIRETRDDFAYVRASDAYEGWMLRKHLQLFSPEERAFSVIIENQKSKIENPNLLTPQRLYASLQVRILAPVADLMSRPDSASAVQTKLVFGTSAETLRFRSPLSGTWARLLLPNGMTGYVLQSALEPPRTTPFTFREISLLAQRFIGTPYLWGGTTPFGFDCSGFVQRMFSFAGIVLPRDAYLQARSPLGKSVPVGKPTQAGDLVFFCGQSDPRGRGITHVGLALNRREFIHASGRSGITITAFDEPEFNQVYTYRGAWRCASLPFE